MSTSNAVTSRDAEALAATIAGDVVAAPDDGYDEARRAWNLSVDQRPAVVVFAESAEDVTRAVQFARSHELRIAPQGTGHGSLPLEPLEGTMLLKTSRMRRVDIDPAARTARAEAGALWHDVTVRAAGHGLAALAGSSAVVGVTGYTLGGGIGWLTRRYGLAASSVTAAEIVTADGRLVRADPANEPDLLWAIRGGGGLGVVTGLEMSLYPVAELYAGALFFPIARAAEVLPAWREWTATVPDEVTSLCAIMRFPPIPDVPEFARGRHFAVLEAACIADEAAGARLISPLRALGPELDTFAVIAAPELGHIHMDPEQPVPYQGDGVLLADLPAAAIDAVLSQAGPDADTPLLMVEIRHLGGAAARPAADGGALANIDAGFMMYANGFTPTQELAEAVRADARAVKDALTPWRAAYDYYNLVETPADAGTVLPDTAYHRLQEIKAAWDPGQVIVSAHPVQLAAHLAAEPVTAGGCSEAEDALGVAVSDLLPVGVAERGPFEPGHGVVA